MMPSACKYGSLGWRALYTPTSETPDFGGHVTPLTLQYLWPRPPGVWLGGLSCKPVHSGWSVIVPPSLKSLGIDSRNVKSAPQGTSQRRYMTVVRSEITEPPLLFNSLFNRTTRKCQSFSPLALNPPTMSGFPSRRVCKAEGIQFQDVIIVFSIHIIHRIMGIIYFTCASWVLEWEMISNHSGNLCLR